jgi:hypothetical protein
MFKSIKSILERYDKKIFAWLEGKGTTRSRSKFKASRGDHEGTAVSKRGVVPKRNVLQIPDPWD